MRNIYTIILVLFICVSCYTKTSDNNHQEEDILIDYYYSLLFLNDNTLFAAGVFDLSNTAQCQISFFNINDNNTINSIKSYTYAVDYGSFNDLCCSYDNKYIIGGSDTGYLVAFSENGIKYISDKYISKGGGIPAPLISLDNSSVDVFGLDSGHITRYNFITGGITVPWYYKPDNEKEVIYTMPSHDNENYAIVYIERLGENKDGFGNECKAFLEIKDKEHNTVFKKEVNKFYKIYFYNNNNVLLIALNEGIEIYDIKDNKMLSEDKKEPIGSHTDFQYNKSEGLSFCTPKGDIVFYSLKENKIYRSKIMGDIISASISPDFKIFAYVLRAKPDVVVLKDFKSLFK